MGSSRGKIEKFTFEIIWIFLSLALSILAILAGRLHNFWSYPILMYSIPIIANMIFFKGIYDKFIDEESYTRQYKKIFKINDKIYLKKKYKIHKVVCCFILAFIFIEFFSALGIVIVNNFSNYFKDFVDSKLFFVVLGIFYFFSLVCALTEKIVSKVYSNLEKTEGGK